MIKVRFKYLIATFSIIIEFGFTVKVLVLLFGLAGFGIQLIGKINETTWNYTNN